MRNLFALGVGLLFGLGLCLSGMSDPGKVLGFLDLAGAWDPSLALVMGGAIAAAFIPFQIAKHSSAAWLGGAIDLPQGRRLDVRLAIGALIFGAGWGAAGMCPGPVLVDLGFLCPAAYLFATAMIAGIAAADLNGRRARPHILQDA